MYGEQNLFNKRIIFQISLNKNIHGVQIGEQRLQVHCYRYVSLGDILGTVGI